MYKHTYFGLEKPRLKVLVPTVLHWLQKRFPHRQLLVEVRGLAVDVCTGSELGQREIGGSAVRYREGFIQGAQGYLLPLEGLLPPTLTPLEISKFPSEVLTPPPPPHDNFCKYHSLPSKRPWALGIHGPKTWGWALTRNRRLCIYTCKW